MRFTYAEGAPRQTAQPNRRLQVALTAALAIVTALAAWEIATFAIDYWRALHG